jgi:hypothetical protein
MGPENILQDSSPGAIYRAEHVHSGKVVAVKIQHVDEECPTNRYERGFYPDLQGGVGMPTLWYTGVQGPLDYLVIDLLGVSLDNIYRQNGKKVMDLRSVCCIAIQMVRDLNRSPHDLKIESDGCGHLDLPSRVHALARDPASGYPTGQRCSGPPTK